MVMHSTPMEEREEKVHVTQTKPGYLLMDGEQVKILSPRLRKLPLDQWQHEDRMEELRYKQARRGTRSTSVRRRPNTKPVHDHAGNLHAAWGR